MGDSVGAIMRAWGLALLAVAIWFLCARVGEPRQVTGLDAPAANFSAGRAEAVLARILGPERPHPVGSTENAAVRARILSEFAKLGVTAQTYRAFTCNTWRGPSYATCATVTDIIADVVPGTGKAIVLLAHYDSVPAGPGASDDESGVATVLETVRALKARGTKSLHPVIALISDGEEGGLLGANAFLQNAQLSDRVGIVVNVEARGTRGPSLLFQTSPGDGRLIDLYAASVPIYATSSLYAEIYKILPNDTDLTLFIRKGFPSFNFAFADNVRYYHSPFDIRAKLDPATLQMHGNNMLGVAAALEKTDYAALKGGNDVYITMFGHFLPRMPASWALPLSILILIAIGAASWFARSKDTAGWRNVVSAATMPLLLLLGSGLFGWLLSFLAQMVSGHPDPTYAYANTMRFALAFGVWTVALLVSRMVRFEPAAASAWLWVAGLGVVTAAFLPGFSPYFLFPALVPAILLPITARSGWSVTFGQTMLFVCALGALLIWMPLVVSGETLMGLRLHPMFTIPAAFALIAIVPLLAARPMSRRAATISIAVSAIAAIALAAGSGLQPAYSKGSPQRINIIYLENGKTPARWIADTSWKGIGAEPIPSQLQQAGPFRLGKDAWEGLLPGDGYTAAAGAPFFPLPTATIVSDRIDAITRTVELGFHASETANGMIVSIPKDAMLVSADLRGQRIETDGYSGSTRLLCLTPDCRDLHITLVLADKGAVSIAFAEVRYGLPAFGARLQAARPATAMASQSGDETVLANTVTLAAH